MQSSGMADRISMQTAAGVGATHPRIAVPMLPNAIIVKLRGLPAHATSPSPIRAHSHQRRLFLSLKCELAALGMRSGANGLQELTPPEGNGRR